MIENAGLQVRQGAESLQKILTFLLLTGLLVRRLMGFLLDVLDKEALDIRGKLDLNADWWGRRRLDDDWWRRRRRFHAAHAH
jgi:hypothetical protein